MTTLAHLIRMICVYTVFMLAAPSFESDYGKWFLLVVCLVVITIVSGILGKVEGRGSK